MLRAMVVTDALLPSASRERQPAEPPAFVE
jgi:hypothetical protein